MIRAVQHAHLLLYPTSLDGFHFRSWHIADMMRCLIRVRYAHQSGRPPTRLVYDFTPSPTRTASSQSPKMGFEALNPSQALRPLPISHRACDKLTRRAKFRFRRRATHLYDSRHPVPEEGALAIVTERWDGMRWTRRHRARDGTAGRDKLRERSQDVLTSGAKAYGKVVWIRRLSGRRQVCGRQVGPTGRG
jgi:hypothetical protein